MKPYKIVNEVYLLGDVVGECLQMDENSYKKMSLEQLSKFYDKIENGLISFNLLSKEDSSLYEEALSDLTEDIYGIEKYLESQLLGIVASVIIRNPSHPFLQRFKDSLWNFKIKDKMYYNNIFELTGMEEKYKDNIYNYLQS